MVFNEISALKIGYSKEVEEIFPNLKPSQTNKICSYLSSKGYLHRLKRGIYLVQERPSAVPVIRNQYKTALALFKGYIGFSSALRVYDLLDYAPFTIFVVTVNKSREKRVRKYTFKAVPIGKRAVGLTYHKGIYLSTISKTFFDCFLQTAILPSGKAGGKYIKEWKVLDNLGKENTLSWCYHG